MSSNHTTSNQASNHKTLIAAIVVIGLGSFAIWDGSRKEKAEKKADEETVLIHADTADINSLLISNIKGQKISLERIAETPAKDGAKDGTKDSAKFKDGTTAKDKVVEATPQSASVGQWKMLEPIKDSADAVAIQSVLGTVKTEKSHQVVAEGKDVNWAVYGLDHPVVTLVLNSKNPTGIAKSETIEIGGVKAYDSNLYARVDHEDKVLLVSSEWDVLLSRLPREYRDKRLLRDRDGLNFTKIEFSSKASGAGSSKIPALHFTLSAKDQKWTLEDGLSTDASESISELAVMNYLSQIKAAHALEFIADDKTAPGALKAAGLSDPASVVKIYPDDASTPITLQFAEEDKSKTNVAAVSSEIQPIVTVYRSFVDGLKKPAKDFFDKHAPFQFKLADVAKIQIQTKGSLAQNALDLELIKKGNDWSIATKGLQKQIDNTKLNEMIQRIGELEAVRFVQPVASVPTRHSPLPKKAKDGESSTLNIGQMSNHIRLMRADGSLVLELKWGELLFEKSDVKGLSPEDAKLPGQVDAQFVATETNQSKWLMGVPEGSIRDLGIYLAITDPLPPAGANSKAAPTGSAPAKSAAPVQTPSAKALPPVEARFQEVAPHDAVKVKTK